MHSLHACVPGCHPTGVPGVRTPIEGRRLQPIVFLRAPIRSTYFKEYFSTMSVSSVSSNNSSDGSTVLASRLNVKRSQQPKAKMFDDVFLDTIHKKMQADPERSSLLSEYSKVRTGSHTWSHTRHARTACACVGVHGASNDSCDSTAMPTSQSTATESHLLRTRGVFRTKRSI